MTGAGAWRALALLVALAAPPAALARQFDPDPDAPHREACVRQGLTDAECNGRRIWYNATGGNERFYTYTFPQRIGVQVDWYRVLGSKGREGRFHAWGIINDPSCCQPGVGSCPAKSLEETFGFDYCPGDDELLKAVRTGQKYEDPACRLRDPPPDPDDPHTRNGALDQRQSACDLRFGTSTGALGFRKFPNPRFDAERWARLGGWEELVKPISERTRVPSDRRVTRLHDASIEPPFLIGTTCGSCHIAFDPLRPPGDPREPAWENIKGLVGNQYSRMAELLASGMHPSTLEWQMFAHVRPGVMDTSAIPHDHVNNPGTVNAIINSDQRLTQTGRAITKWRKVASCRGEEADGRCWCEPGRRGKCWLKSTRTDDRVHVLLKGGEDSIGAIEAMQRVFINIGSCAEQCWVNHLADLRQLVPGERGFGQTPMSIAQCRRDCPNFRAIEDRMPQLAAFVFSAEGDATDLHAARNYSRAALVADLEREFGTGAVARGTRLFARHCAGCHSSLPSNRRTRFTEMLLPPPDFHLPDASHPRRMRRDFMSGDRTVAASAVGTFRCRALHSNHMQGHIYEEYAPHEVHEREPVADLAEPTEGGRGYYRVPSLLNVWATAPFMHNNAIGPEVCGAPGASRPRYVDANGKLLAQQPECSRFDPSVEGRFALFKRSAWELLNPRERGRKSTFIDHDIELDLRIRRWHEGEERPRLGFLMEVRKEFEVHSGFLASFRHKDLANDLYDAFDDPLRVIGAGKALILPQLLSAGLDLAKAPERFVEVMLQRRELLRGHYRGCKEDIENEGHTFGSHLSDEEKRALVAFLATL